MEDNIGSVMFNLAYLAVIWVTVVFVILKAPAEKTKQWKTVFYSFVLLAFGDIFHLITRTYIFFNAQTNGTLDTVYSQPETIKLLGFGLIMTSITVQLFYLGMYFYWRHGEAEVIHSKGKNDNVFFRLDVIMFFATISRFVLIAFPQNEWGSQVDDINWFRYITNIPVYIGGITIMILFFQRAKRTGHDDTLGFRPEDRKMIKNVAIWMTVSYLTYSMTLFLSWVSPYFGMAMIPKTIAYLVMLLYFYKGLLVKKQ